MPLERTGIVAILKRIHLFRNSEDSRLEMAADLMEEVEYHAGDRIFAQGDDPDYFYIVANGRVQLSRENGTPQPTPWGIIEEDDYFGEEVLEANWPRQINASAASDVDLLRISVPNFVAMLDIISPLAQRLQFILDSYKLSLRVQFSWREPEEALYFVSRRHRFFLLTMILPPTLFSTILIPLFTYFYLSNPMFLTLFLLMLIVLACAGLWFWNYVDWSNDYYVVTSRKVVYQERVVLLYDSRQESPLAAIQSASMTTTQWGRWIGYGNVAIRTYTGTILFRNVGYPDQVLALIQQRQLRAQIQQRRENIEEIRKFIEDRIRFGPRLPTLPPERKPQPKPDFMREFLSTMFHLRYEKGKTIIYRTHWFILLKKIWLPTLILLGMFLLFIYRVANQTAVISIQAACGLSFVVGSIVFLWWLYQYMDWHNDEYLITNDQVVDVYRKPLGQEERDAAQIKNILSIEYKRMGLSGLLLNFGTVYIRVGDRQLTFDDIYRPSNVQRELFHRMAEVNSEERKTQLEAEKQRMGDWFASYNQWARQATGGPPPPPPVKPPPPGRPGF